MKYARLYADDAGSTRLSTDPLTPRTWQYGYCLVSRPRPVFVEMPDVHIARWHAGRVVPDGSQALGLTCTSWIKNYSDHIPFRSHTSAHHSIIGRLTVSSSGSSAILPFT
jgi:hypothetical protein